MDCYGAKFLSELVPYAYLLRQRQKAIIRIRKEDLTIGRNAGLKLGNLSLNLGLFAL